MGLVMMSLCIEFEPLSYVVPSSILVNKNLFTHVKANHVSCKHDNGKFGYAKAFDFSIVC